MACRAALVNVGDPSPVQGNLSGYEILYIEEEPRYHSHGLARHEDPEFDTYTYGDYPWKGAKANLGRCRPGDYICFHETLVVDGRKERYFIGYFTLQEILAYEELAERGLVDDPRYRNNAHLKRNWVLAGSDTRFTLFKGDPTASTQLRPPVRFDRELVQRIGFVDAKSRALDFGKTRRDGQRFSELQVISMYTRNVRLLDEEQTSRLMRLLR